MTSSASAVSARPNVATLLQWLIRFDTTNPPGNERECAVFCRDVLGEVGISAELMGDDPDRVNVISRLRGSGKSPPILAVWAHRRCTHCGSTLGRASL